MSRNEAAKSVSVVFVKSVNFSLGYIIGIELAKF